MSKPTYFIHVGPMKTGSTYLQRCIDGARDALLDAGVYFPTELADPKTPTVHTPVLTAVRKPEQFDAMHATFAALSASGHKNILVSYEFFTKLGLAGVKRLRDMINTPDVRIVYAVRRWSDRIPSMAFQHIFGGGTQTLPAFLADLVGGQENDPEIDYAIVWERWAEVFGRDKLMLFPFSNIVDEKDDVFDRFCTDVLGIEKLQAPPARGAKAWASPSTPDTELLRVLNTLHAQQRPDQDGAPDAAMYWGWMKLRKETDLRPLLDEIRASETHLKLDDRASHFNATYARLQDYADCLTGSDRNGTVFTRKSRDAAYIKPDYLLRPNMVDTLRTHYATITKAGWARRGGGGRGV